MLRNALHGALLLLGLLSGSSAEGSVEARQDAAVQLTARQGTPGAGVLRNFMVHEPVLTPAATTTSEDGDDAHACVVTQTLMQYSFANSYGKPYVGAYTPPTNCRFNRVTLNFTATSRGRQFDRLAIMYLGDYEVWRTSTAEPTRDGIVWTYTKEMQQYLALWRAPQTLIFDLGNIVDDTYTAPFNTTLTATFFYVPDSPRAADRILAISKRQGAAGAASVFQLPDDKAVVSDTLPPTVERAVVSVAACGQIGEEFWYTNVYDDDAAVFNASSPLPAGGPWREVQVLVDGQLAGVSWPFPVIFTGGVVPGLWRPIVGIDTFDLREHEIDITPWLGRLLDGQPHTYEIRVAAVGAPDGHGGAAVAETPTSYWLVTGKIFLFLNADNKTTQATAPSVAISGPGLRVARKLTTKGSLNDTLIETTSASRSVDIRAKVNGKEVSWTQHLSYTNTNRLAANGTVQNTTQEIRGSDAAAAAGYSATYDFPITVNQAYQLTATGDLARIDGDLTHGQTLTVRGSAVFPSGVQPFNRTVVNTTSPLSPSLIAYTDSSSSSFPQSPLLVTLPSSLPVFDGAVRSTTLSGSATYLVTSNGTSSTSFSFGETTQHLRFAGTSRQNDGRVTELYTRDVAAVNTTVTRDRSVLLGNVIRENSAETYGGPRPLDEKDGEGEVAVSGGGRKNLGLVRQIQEQGGSDGEK